MKTGRACWYGWCFEPYVLIDPVSDGLVDPWNQDLFAKLWFRILFCHLPVPITTATAVMDGGAVHIELAKLEMGLSKVYKFVLGSGEVEQSEYL